MASFNKVILLGNLTRDPEMRQTPSGTAVCSFGIATNRKYRQGEEQKEEVCFVDITVFGRQAELATQYLSKGRMVLLEGRLQYRTWEDQNGQRRNKLDVVAENINFMPRSDGQRDSQRAGQPSGGGYGGPGDLPPPGDDDIPFVFIDASLHTPDELPRNLV